MKQHSVEKKRLRFRSKQISTISTLNLNFPEKKGNSKRKNNGFISWHLLLLRVKQGNSFLCKFLHQVLNAIQGATSYVLGRDQPQIAESSLQLTHVGGQKIKRKNSKPWILEGFQKMCFKNFCAFLKHLTSFHSKPGHQQVMTRYKST